MRYEPIADRIIVRAGEEIARLARENGAMILVKWLESAIAQVIDGIRFSNR